MLKKIASFTVNHDILVPGLYLSRVDGNDITYDLRLKTPNQGDYLENSALHTLEHLIATYLRSSRFSDDVVYFGPMGCRTGFNMILRDTIEALEAIALTREAFQFAADYEGEIPGARRRECGNYLEHDLSGAREEAARYVQVLTFWQPENLAYPTEAEGTNT